MKLFTSILLSLLVANPFCLCAMAFSPSVAPAVADEAPVEHAPSCCSNHSEKAPAAPKGDETPEGEDCPCCSFKNTDKATANVETVSPEVPELDLVEYGDFSEIAFRKLREFSFCDQLVSPDPPPRWWGSCSALAVYLL